MKPLKRKIKDLWSQKNTLVSHLVLGLLFLLSQGCVTRARINAKLWYGIAIPEDICEKTPEVKSYGIFRKLNNGKFEFVSICSDEYQDFFSIHKDDLERLLNEAGIKR